MRPICLRAFFFMQKPSGKKSAGDNLCEKTEQMLNSSLCITCTLYHSTQTNLYMRSDSIVLLQNSL